MTKREVMAIKKMKQMETFSPIKIRQILKIYQNISNNWQSITCFILSSKTPLWELNTF